MTDEQLPTRRSRRLQREADQREDKLNQIADGTVPQTVDPVTPPRADDAASADSSSQPAETPAAATGSAPETAPETAQWGPEPSAARPDAPARLSASARSASLPQRGATAKPENPAQPESPAQPATGAVRRTSAYATGPTPVEPPTPATFPTSANSAPSTPAAPTPAPSIPSIPVAEAPADPFATATTPAFAASFAPETPVDSVSTGAPADTSSTADPAGPGSFTTTGDDIPASFAPGAAAAASSAATPALDLGGEDEDRSVEVGHARIRRSHRALKVVALSVAALIVFAGAAVGTIYERLRNNIEVIEVNDLVGNTDPAATVEEPSDPSDGEALNYLIIGVDDRSGDNGEFTDDNPGGSRSDTTMVMHISENRKRIEIVSIPRDTMVQVPSCQLTGGGTTNAFFGMFNAAYAVGYDQGGDKASAIACVWRTVQENSGVKIDGAMMVDFSGFASVVDAINGVYMCIPEETISKDAGKLHLQAGWQTLNGTDALNYARARKGTGQNFDGSDLNRAGRQQQMVAAIFNQVTEDGILTSPTRLYAFADAVTKTLTVTDTLKNTQNLVGLAYSLRNVKPKNVTLMTIPFEAYPPDHNRVQMSAAAADVWENMAADKPIVESEKTTSTSTTTTKSETEEATKTPGREAFTAEDTTAVCADPATSK